jgi:hypothetical protein
LVWQEIGILELNKMLEFTIFLGIIVGILKAITKISNTREGLLPASKEYSNIISYLLRD